MTQQIQPRQGQTEPEVGLSNQGYRPKPDERSLTREEWKEKFRSERAAPRRTDGHASGSDFRTRRLFAQQHR